MRALAVAALALVMVSAAFAATINGTQGPDRIYGTGSDDTISAGAGGDTVFGQGGDDTIRGNSDVDELYGGLGDDYLSGGPTVPPDEGDGSDYLWGRAGNDTLLLTGPESGGAAIGGAGDDTFRTDNDRYVDQPLGNLDRILCGTGHDVVYADSADLPWWDRETWAAAGCEVVYVNGKKVPVQ